jgi:hypothetical protein
MFIGGGLLVFILVLFSNGGRAMNRDIILGIVVAAVAILLLVVFL